jgi:hypothetical protein
MHNGSVLYNLAVLYFGLPIGNIYSLDISDGLVGTFKRIFHCIFTRPASTMQSQVMKSSRTGYAAQVDVLRTGK